MDIAKQIFLLVLLAASLLLASCGGGGGSTTTAPSAPLNVTVNRGDAAASLGWDVPSSNGGAAIDSYSLVISPTVAAADVLVSGTRALLRNLSNGVSYTVTVHAHNSAGNGASSSGVSVTPNATSISAYTPITIQGDTSPSGVFDPAALRLTNGDLWMSYSSVTITTTRACSWCRTWASIWRRAPMAAIHSLLQARSPPPAVATVTDSSLVGLRQRYLHRTLGIRNIVADR